MKLNEHYEKVAALDDEWLLVPLDGSSHAITLNHTGSEIWDCLSAGCTEEQIVEAFVRNYAMDELTAQTFVRDFISTLAKYGAVEYNSI